MSADPRVREVLDFWVGEHPDDGQAAVARRDFWYRGGPAVDEAIRDRFGALVEEARRGEPSVMRWTTTAEGAAALVIVLDQFTRHLFRGTADAWSGDTLAMSVAREAVARGMDRGLPIATRLFLYHPYHHSERLDEQDEALRLVDALIRDAGPEWEAYFPRTGEAFRGHREKVARFGRFPHRNAALGRESTPEELAFLEENPEHHGQDRPPGGTA